MCLERKARRDLKDSPGAETPRVVQNQEKSFGRLSSSAALLIVRIHQFPF